MFPSPLLNFLILSFSFLKFLSPIPYYLVSQPTRTQICPSNSWTTRQQVCQMDKIGMDVIKLIHCMNDRGTNPLNWLAHISTIIDENWQVTQVNNHQGLKPTVNHGFQNFFHFSHFHNVRCNCFLQMQRCKGNKYAKVVKM